jgi:hypothetical protein
LEKGIRQVVWVKQGLVEINYVCHVHEDLIESQPFYLATPGKRLQEFVKSFGRIAKPCQVFT